MVLWVICETRQNPERMRLRLRVSLKDLFRADFLLLRNYILINWPIYLECEAFPTDPRQGTHLSGGTRIFCLNICSNLTGRDPESKPLKDLRSPRMKGDCITSRIFFSSRICLCCPYSNRVANKFDIV